MISAEAWKVLSGKGKSDARPSNTKVASKTECDAKAYVLNVLKAPEVLAQLKLGPGASNQERLSALARATDPAAVLRAAGCSAERAKKVALLLPDIVQPVGLLTSDLLRQAHPCCSKRTMCIGCTLLTSVVLLITALGLSLASTTGWRVGTCALEHFTNQTCTGIECMFSVSVHEEVCDDSSCKSEHFVASRWRPVQKWNYWQGRAAWDGDAFRCCDETGTLDCCSFYDPRSEQFCDNWPQKTDSDGNSCSSGRWFCLFKTNNGLHGKEITELEVYNKPPVLPLIIAGLVIGSIGVCILAWSLKCGTHCGQRTSWVDKVEELAPIEQETVSKEPKELKEPKEPKELKELKEPKEQKIPAKVPTPVIIPSLEGGLHLQVSWRVSKEPNIFIPEFTKSAGEATDLQGSPTNSTAATESSAVLSEPRNGSKMSSVSNLPESRRNSKEPNEPHDSCYSSRDSCYSSSETTSMPDFMWNDKLYTCPVLDSKIVPRPNSGLQRYNPEGIEEIPLGDHLLLQSGDLVAYAKRPVGGLLPSLLEPRKKTTLAPHFGGARNGRPPIPEKHQQAWALS